MAQVGWHFITQATPGAPPMAGTNGYANDFLNWLLVTIGGWTRPFHNAATFESVFQMPGGSQRMVYVCHNSAITGAAQKVIIRGCESATGYTYSDLVDPFPTVAQVADGSCNVLASTGANTTARNVRAQVWESGFVVEVDTNGTNQSWLPWVFQDPWTSYGSDTWATLVMTRNNAGTTGSGNLLSASSTIAQTTALYICRTIDGLVKSSRGCLAAGTNGIGNWTGGPTMSAGYLGQPRHMPLKFTCTGSSTTVPAPAIALQDRGAIIGLRLPVHAGVGSLTADDYFQDSAYSPGSELRPLFFSAVSGVIHEETNTWLPT